MKKLDAQLKDNEWLAAGMYGLADICNFAIANGMTRGGYETMLNEEATPGILAWLRRINDRPAVKAMFAHAAEVSPEDRTSFERPNPQTKEIG